MRSVYIPVAQQATNIRLHDVLKRSALSARATEALVAIVQERAGKRRIAVVDHYVMDHYVMDHYSDHVARSACRRVSRSARDAARSAIELRTTVLFATRQRQDPQVIMAAPLLTREDRAWGALVTIGASTCFAPSAAQILEQAAQRIACLLPAGWQAHASLHDSSHDSLHAVAHDSSHERQMPADLPADIAIDALIHELRAPLSAAGFALERLRSLTATEADVQRTHLMTVATTGIAEAHNVMRWFHHQRSAQLQPAIRRPLSIEDAISTAMTLLAGNSLQVNVLLPGDFPLVMADCMGLTHIFTNLLDNAIHHTCPPHQVTIEGWQQPGMAHIAVTSSGSGIAYEQQRTIFQPYGGHQPRGQRNGHGMGLAVAQYLALRMGGYIRVDSDGDTFTTFTLTLPAGASGTAAQLQEEE